jgi:hypothetical protein
MDESYGEFSLEEKGEIEIKYKRKLFSHRFWLTALGVVRSEKIYGKVTEGEIVV